MSIIVKRGKQMLIICMRAKVEDYSFINYIYLSVCVFIYIHTYIHIYTYVYYVCVCVCIHIERERSGPDMQINKL